MSEDMATFKWVFYPALILFVSLIHCSSSSDSRPEGETSTDTTFANVTEVNVSGSDGRYTFRVEISSSDTGCEQYADWWEIVSEDEDLIYRRILLHSHVDEQPFTRGGGPADISAETKVWVRAHMNNNGYGGQVFFGSVNNGFDAMTHPENFATELENVEPLPENCAF